jgi:2-polyprenyl-6-methoxyphenol hydroxylase-like FAD-dependent oxidoreductase
MSTNGNSNGHLDTSRPLDVVIIGGSLGGLAAGIALKRLGHNITILERNPTPLLQNQGAGIVAGGDTLAFFKKYDRCKREFACPSQKRMYLNKAGEIVHEVEMKQAMTSWDLSYYLMRANFDGSKSAYCEVPEAVEGDGEARYRYGCTFTNVTEEKGGNVRVHFATKDREQETIQADLLIAADGPSSSVRQRFIPEVKRSKTGYCALRGLSRAKRRVRAICTG